MENKQVAIKSAEDLKIFLATNYMNQIKNFFSDEKQALKFLSSVMASVQKTPKLLECDAMTVVNSFMTMAQTGLMPSDVSGEAYVLPYKGKAQFQLGYQGLVTLFYRAGGTSVVTEIVRKNDKFSYVNGKIRHEIDIFKSDSERGEVIGAYAIAKLNNGGEISKVMNKKDIVEIGKRYSQSFTSEYSPWNEKNDLQSWMLKKTVLKQLGKMLPKNETIYKAIAIDNEDSVIAKRLDEAEKDADKMKMGNLLKETNKKYDEENNNKKESESEKQNQ